MNWFLIEDDRDDQEFFSLALENLNLDIQCQMESDAHSAIRHLKHCKNPPDLIFLDMRMPKMTGAECIDALRKYKHLQHIPIVLYSSSSALLESKEAIRAGAEHFFVKTANVPELSLRLLSVIDRFGRSKAV